MHVSHHQRRPLLQTDRTRREGGYIMAMFGLLLVPLLLMAGLAVDVGSWYNRASDIQKAADAASLAGVVWLPDVARARSVALEVAEKNGFDNDDPDITVTVNPSTKSPRRLHVVITDNRVRSFFYSNIGGNDIDIARGSFAEYVTPVPMGSPRNFFGLGTLGGTGFDPEYLYQSVNPYCTDKENGDRYQSQTTGGTCSGTLNTEYRTFGYEMYIDAPATRSSGIEVRLFDPRYNEDDATFIVPRPPVCTTVDVFTYPASTTTGWTGPATGTTDITVYGPLQYQTRNNSTTTTYNTVVELAAGQSYTHRRDRIRYRNPAYTWPASTTTGWTSPTGTSSITINGLLQYQTRTSTTAGWTPTTPSVLVTGSSFSRTRNLLRYRAPTYTMTPITTCVNDDETVIENNIDDERNDDGREPYTFTLYSADDTPLDDSDNPQICQQTYNWDSAFDGYQYLGSRRWNTLCTIPTTAPSGKYILRVNNGGAVTTGPEADGSNQWGLVARYTSEAGAGLCDGRVTANCPRVYGKDAISVKADANTSVASFYLAEIGPEHAGKRLKLELFDPGEGGNNLQIMRPTGTNSWTPVDFSWHVGTGTPATTNRLSVTGSVFNGRLVEITVDLTGYNPPSDNNWWQIKYEFTSGVEVTDRTTWSARIIGDPVHLLEEN